MTPPATFPAGEWTTRSAEETHTLGTHLGEFLSGGEIILLDGPLGAGKTLFVKGLAKSLDIDEDEVTSPSFTLVNQYAGRLPLYHVDLYRLAPGAETAHAIGLEEILADEQSVVVIEWAERLGGYPLPPPVWRVSIKGDGDEPRAIIICRP